MDWSLKVEWISKEKIQELNITCPTNYLPFFWDENEKCIKVDNKWPMYNESLFADINYKTIDDFTYPHSKMFYTKDIHPQCSIIYQRFMLLYNMEKWIFKVNANCIHYPISIVPISNMDRKEILNLWNVKRFFPSPMKDHTWEEFKELEEKINPILKSLPNQKAFIKLSSASPKHERGINAYRNARSFIDDISFDTRCGIFLEWERNLKFNSFIVIKPFVEMDSQWEFRCFVKNSKLLAISQQFLYHIFKYDTQILLPLIQRLSNELFLNEISKVYSQVVLDVYFCHQKDQWYLIECNPFGVGSGSSLFHWERDWDLLQGRSNECIIRLVQDPIL